MDKIYYNDFDSIGDLEYGFQERDLSYAEVLAASYDGYAYEGSAFVLFRDKRDGQLYEVNGSHCSCYGLEGQWEPEVAHIPSLKHRIDKGKPYYHGADFWRNVRQILETLND